MKIDIKKVLITLGFLVIAYLTLRFVLPYFIPFLLALTLSVLMEPVVKFLQLRFRLSRSVAVGSVMLFGLGVVFLFCSLFIFTLVSELVDLSYELPNYHETVESIIKETVTDAKYLFYVKLSPEIVSAIHDNLGTVTGALKNFLVSRINSLLNYLYTLPQNITGGITLGVVSLLATFFISKDKELLLRLWFRFTPRVFGQQTLRIVQEMVQAFFRYLQAQLILIAITMVLSIMGLTLIGAKYNITLGLLAGVFDLVPVLGPGIIFVPWIFWSFIAGESLFAFKLLVIYVLVLIIRQGLETKVIAQSLGLHPLVTLLALYLGYKFLGIMGMIVGPILMIALQAIWRNRAIKTFYIRK